MSNMSASDITKALFESMDTIIAARINDIAFDRTIVCEIVDNTYSADGKYTVQKDLIKFEAYCENETKYRVGEKVNVLIPEGDYKRQKVIVSKYQETNTEPIAYIAPLNSMVAIETIDIPNRGKEASGLIANISKDITLWQADLSTYRDAISNNGIYNTLGLKAKFKTLLNDKQVCQGEYGLRLEVGTGYFDEELNKFKVTNAYTFELNTSDMFGNPYNYITYFSFSKKIDISKLGTIGPMRLSLYQNSNFKYYDTDGTKKVYSYSIPEEKIKNNILVQDIQLIFGQDAVIATDNTFTINTHNKLEYNNPKLENDCVRTLYATWFNKNEDSNEYLGYSDGAKVVDKMHYTEYLYAERLDKEFAGAKTAGDMTIPQSRESLQIYYNKDIIQSNYAKLSNYLSKDIYQIITEVEHQLKYCNVPENDPVRELFEPIYNAILDEEAGTGYVFEALPFSNLLPDNENANGAIQDYYNFLQLILAYINNARIVLPQAPKKSGLAITLRRSKKQIFDLIEILNNALKEMFSTYTGLKAYWENKFAKLVDLEKVFDELEEVTIELVEATDKDVVALRADAEDKEIIDFAVEFEEFKKQYENRYYLIWYRANPEASDRFAGEGWENVLEVVPHADNGANQTFKLENYELNSNLLKEKFKAILFFNHVPYESNVIEFTNINPPKEISEAQKINALSIELGDNAKDLYVSYTPYLTLLNLADKTIHRYLRATHKENDVQAFANSYIYWYLPIGNTMLDYDITHLTKKCGLSLYIWPKRDEESKKLVVNDKTDFASYFKEGYYNFYRKLGDIVQATDLQFAYLIKDFYTPNAINNTIKCKIVDSDGFEYKAERSFAFDTFGSNGTDYTLSLRPASSAVALTLKEQKEEEEPIYSLELLARLTDPNGEPMERKDPSIAFVANGEDKGGNPLIYLGTVETYKYGIATAMATNKMITDDIEADEELILTALYPVPLTTGNYYIEGPTTIIYSHLGTQPQYSDTPYRIYEVLAGEETEKDGSHQELTNVIWELHYYNSKDSEFAEVLPTDPLTDEDLKNSNITQESKYKSIISGQPKLQNKDTGVHLQPATMYITNDIIKTSIVCKNKNTNEVLYIQPILILQNQHASSMLNQWNEKLIIDEENGIILSAMMGAGYKDENNKFHGVLMGDISESFEGQLTKSTGLFGFQKGAQTFALKTDGTLTLGASGHGQIKFDGQSGVIESAGFSQEGQSGMQIDLAKNTIKAKGGFVLEADGTGGSILINAEATEYPLKIGEDFKVAWDGSVYATKGIIDAATIHGMLIAGQIEVDSLEAKSLQVIDSQGNIIFNADKNNANTVSLGGFRADNNSLYKYLNNSVWGSNEPYAPDMFISTGTGKKWKIGSEITGYWEDYWCIGAGQNFGVSTTGKLYAKGAEIEGNITTIKGKFGVWEIGLNKIGDIEKIDSAISATVHYGTVSQKDTYQTAITPKGIYHNVEIHNDVGTGLCYCSWKRIFDTVKTVLGDEAITALGE